MTESNPADAEFFNETIDKLTEELLKIDLQIPNSALFPVTDEELRRSAWLASYLSNSDKESHHDKSLALATLAYIKKRGTDEEDLYKQYLYIVLSRLGNLPAFNNIRKPDESYGDQAFEDSIFNSYDPVLNSELQTAQQKYQINEKTVLSGFQKEVYDALNDGKDVAISGPTSSGKSFILREYIDSNVDNESSFDIIYVVPTRALISEVSRKLSDRFSDVDIETGAYFSEEEENVDGSTNTFLVVTPERCLNLISEDQKSALSPSLVFFDEIQNLESGERGVIFENIIKSLTDNYPDAQIVSAGPYLKNSGVTLSSLTKREVEEVETSFAPVLQLKTILRFQRGGGNASGRRMMNATVYSPSGNQREVGIEEPEEVTFSDFDSNKKSSIPSILQEFGSGTKNILYASRRDFAEERAVELSNSRDNKRVSGDIQELVEFLRNSIHDEYSLASCLESGVAYHHGMVPKIAREEIERIYRDQESIDTMVSTPTLLQGVSLPAEKIFLVGDKKGRDDLTSFDFNNLIGRVGRLDTKLYGSIYCITTEDDDWAKEQFENVEEKEVEPVTTKALDRPEDLISTLTRENIIEEEDGSLRYTGILLRNRYLRDPGSVTEYLREHDVDESDIKRIKIVLKETLDSISIPTEIVRKSPTTDPILQDELYRKVHRNPERWIIATGRTGYEYDKLQYICEELNKIFKFTYDRDSGIDPPENEAENMIGSIVFTANLWLKGRSYKKMIQNRIESEIVNDGGVDKSISNLFELVDKDIQFVLVKYFGILSRILEDMEREDTSWMERFDQMLDLGTMDMNEIKLMVKGVDRSVAIDLYIPNNTDDVIEYLNSNRDRIQDFYISHLENQGILK